MTYINFAYLCGCLYEIYRDLKGFVSLNTTINVHIIAAFIYIVRIPFGPFKLAYPFFNYMRNL